VELPALLAGMTQREARERRSELLGELGIEELAAHVPGRISGGQQQRVALARALVNHPAVLLADEPTGNLDETTAADLHRLLRDMHREHGLTSIIVTHNPVLAAACDRVLRLEGGRLVAV